MGRNLAFIGSMNDEVIVLDELALELISQIRIRYPEALPKRYGFAMPEKETEILSEIAKSRSCYGKGDVLDLSKAASILIEDFRGGRLGRMTLERVQECEKDA